MSGNMSTQVKNWTPDQLRFIAWSALPKAEKRPKTQKELAGVIEVSEKTLCEWKRLPGFADEVTRLAKEYMKDDGAEVLSTIRRLAKAGSVPHLNMYLAMTGLAEDVANAGKGPGGDYAGARERLFERLARRLESAESGG
jgi:hypothetical protein